MYTRWTVTLLLLTVAVPCAHAEHIPLRAGPLTMFFDVDGAFLRFIRIGKHEVLRGINAPIRNRFWGTVKPEVSNLHLDRHGDDAFTMTFDVSCREREIDFFWKGKIVGNATGQIDFTFDGEARSTFMRNRIGFCILHAPAAAGKPWVLEDTDGAKTHGLFPRFIAPHQPAKNLRAITHVVKGCVFAEVRCEGDTFEMEDQRNWTDASFKTYCTPLEIPYPVRVDQGTKISQKVQIRLKGDITKILSPDNKSEEGVTLTLVDGPDAAGSLIRIGLQLSSQVDALGDRERKLLRGLNLHHLRLSLTPSDDPLVPTFKRATTQAQVLGVPLHIGLQLGQVPKEGLKQIIAAFESTRPPVTVWSILATDQKTFQTARSALRSYKPDALIGVGEDTHFTELNRNRPADPAVQVVSFGLNPQAHAYDDLTMVENLEIQTDAIKTARQFIGDRPLWVGPITLRDQLIQQAPLSGELPSNVDARQPSLFVAGWTLGSVKYLSEAGVQGATYYETVGWKGIMAAGGDSPHAAVFPAKPGEIFPVYHVLRAIGEFAGGEVREVRTTDTLAVVGLALTRGERKRLMVANLADQGQLVRIRGLNNGQATLYRLDRTNLNTARSDPDAFANRAGQPIEIANRELTLQLPPHGIARID